MKESALLRIVVGIDGSRQSLVALRWALREAVSVGAVVEVVHCWQPHPITDILFGSTDELHRGSLCMLQNEVRAALTELPASAMQPEVQQTSRLGRAAHILTDRAAGAHLLVLGAHGRTAAADLAFGRVAASCLRHAGCPIVVVENEHTIIRHDTGTPMSVTIGN